MAATATPHEWYRIQAKAEDPSVVEIDIYDFIGDWIDNYWGFGITAKAFLEVLKKLPDTVKTIRLRVNSPGGDFYSATAIANLLRDQQASKGRTVEAVIDGLAASAATIITSAATKGKVAIADTAEMFVHNPLTVLIGFFYPAELRKRAEDLDKVAKSIITAYRWRSSLSEEELQELMDAETLMDADEAITWGFADQKIEGLPAMAVAFDRRGLPTITSMPEEVRARIEAQMEKAESQVPAPSPADPAAVLADCAAAGCSLEFAQGLVAAKVTAEEARTRILADVSERQAEAAWVAEIRGLCAAAKLPDLADGYIAAKVPAATVKTHLTTITAKMDAVEITTTLPADGDRPARSPSRLNPSAVYAERNARAGHRGA